MSKTPSLTSKDSKDIIKILIKKGFVLDRSKGSHQIWIHPILRNRAIVPMHSKDLPMGTFMNILKQAGIRKEEI